jgi:glycosyltransferase involved in cell wall biosynthesis
MEFKPQLVVIPWWTIFWAPCFGYLAMALKRKGVPVLFFCHNVIEHESGNWKFWLTRKVLANGKRFVVHAQEDKINLNRLFPNPDVTVHVHPIYDQFPAAKGVLPRRRNLELLFYGFVRPYKGLGRLIEAMGKLKGEDVQLTVAGEFWEGEEEIRLRIKNLGIDNQVELRSRYHTDQETAELFERADIVVLPYRSATGTGVVPVAYHYDTPVIVTRVGGLPDVVQDGLTGWIVDPQCPEALVEVIDSATSEKAYAMRLAIQKLKKTMSWESMIRSFIQNEDN